MAVTTNVEKLVVQNQWVWRATYTCSDCGRGYLEDFDDVATPEEQITRQIEREAEDHHCYGFGGEQ